MFGDMEVWMPRLDVRARLYWFGLGSCPWMVGVHRTGGLCLIRIQYPASAFGGPVRSVGISQYNC